MYLDRKVVARRDGLSNDALRQLAVATRDVLGSGIAALVGSSDGKGVVAVAVSKDLVELGISAGTLARAAAQSMGGSASPQPDVSVGGGPNGDAVAEAVDVLTEQARAGSGAGA